ncbi:arylsulfatase [Ferruginibacter sp.]|nr:arylsulfatase [Ferruginibacter sp.]
MKQTDFLKNNNARFIITFILLLSGGYCLAQHSPAKKYNDGIIKYDTVTKAFKNAYSVKAPAGTPNIVVIMLDDVGFSTAGTFGGIAETPVFDSLANNGLKYNNFHTTALCAPSRAALLTGRNHHSVHMGHFTETAFDAPGYDGYMPFEKATMAEVLRENGYNTFAVGKWHLTPVAERTAAGPFNRWPTGRGFDRFYGFHESATDQYHPVLWEGNTRVHINTKKEIHLNTYLADASIKYIGEQKRANPDKPFLLYLTPGAVHSPLQVDKEWIDKYKGKFDMGWDKYPEIVLANQKKLGVVPEYVTLLPRDERIRAWDDLPADEKKIMARAMEAHAGFLSQTDYEIGRVMNYLLQIGQLENTIVFVIIGDNGATKYTADLPELSNGQNNLTREERVSAALKDIDKIGTRYFNGDIALGWTQASNAPFKLWKCDANAEGGTHNPLIVFYPKMIKEKGGIRNQFVHLIDIWPSIIEITKAKIPALINGYKQEQIEGTSMMYSLNNAKANDRHTLQYFETGANRALYKDGWKAATYHKPGGAFADDVWELYDMKNDFNERVNLADKYPGKLKELRALFEIEAKKYNVYPLQESWFPETKYLRISDSRDVESEQ